MGPTLDLFRSANQKARKGTPVVVKMENPNYSLLQIDGPEDEVDATSFRPVEKGRGKNAKQFTWVLLLKAHQAVGCVAWTAAGLWSLIGAVKTRLALHGDVEPEADDGEEEKIRKGTLLLKFIKVLLFILMLALVIELAAYWNQWDFQTHNYFHIPQTEEIRGWAHMTYILWLSFRADYIAYPIQAMTNICVVLFVLQSLDRTILCIGCLWIKLNRIKPKALEDPFKSDVEDCLDYKCPMVLVQIPMCNEREVCVAL